MTSITIATRHLVGLLQDALETAGDDPAVTHQNAVLIHTDRGEWVISADGQGEDEPLFAEVTSDLLVATTVAPGAVGQGHTLCEGQLTTPILVSVASVKAVIAVFKELITKSSLPKTVTHQVTIERAYSSLTLDIREDPTLVEDGRSISVPMLDTECYPRDIVGILSPDPLASVMHEGAEVPVSYGTGLDGRHLAAVANVAKRRKMPVAWYRHHHHRRIVVEVGRSWRCVFLPRVLEAEQYVEPLAQVFQPNLPREDSPEQQPTLATVS